MRGVGLLVRGGWVKYRGEVAWVGMRGRRRAPIEKSRRRASFTGAGSFTKRGQYQPDPAR